jgi:hypothetical protein
MSRPKKNPEFVTLKCHTCGKDYEVNYQKRNKQRFCSRICSVNNPEVKQKNRDGVKATFDEKYGGHPMATNKETLENYKSSMLEKYGVEYAPKMKDFSEKVKASKLERFGDENYNNIDGMKTTMLEKYGVDNYRKTDEYKEKYVNTCIKKYGIEHASKSKQYKDSHKKLMFEKFTSSERFKNFIPQFTFEEYQGVTKKFNQKYTFKCRRCNNVEDHDLCDGKDVKCSKCDKIMSGFQTEVVDYIKSIFPNEPIVTNNRVILSPFELDIYLPSKNIAIETNGLYWHTEVSGGKNKNYHSNKTRMASAKGIRLIHIFENEWKLKKDITKSVISTMFIKNKTVIYARKCEIREVKPSEKTKFLSENHLQGTDHATVKLGLYYDNELVSIMTFVKSRFDKTIEWEMSRFCTKLHTRVVGGSSKLFKHFIRTYNPKSVVSYSDRRYFSGETYLKLGFNFAANTPPNYHYTIDGYVDLQNRINWQKGKLSKKLLSFDSTLSEWENMKINGFDRIWDCGHSKWIWRNNI